MNAPNRLANLHVNPEWAKLPLFDRSKWQRVRFGDVVENLNETCDPAEEGIERYVGLEHLEPGSLQIRSWGGVSNGTTFTRRAKPGQVLFGKRRAYQRKIAVASFDAVVSGDIYVLAAKGGRLIDDLLPFLCMSDRFFEHAVGTSAGSLSPRTNWSSLASFEFDLPPLSQQAQIADVLSEINAARAAVQRASSALNEHRQALLDSIGLSYAKAHSLVELDAVIEEGRPICYGILKPGLGVPEGIPVIKVRDYPDGYVKVDDLLRTTPEIEAPFRRSRLRGGDLLLSIRGTVGRLAEVPSSLDGANVTQDTARLSIVGKHNREYVRAVLESRFLQKQIAARITGLAVKGINIGEVRKLQLPLPPRREQDRIADRMREIAEAVGRAEGHVDDSTRLLALMSSQLFGAAI